MKIYLKNPMRRKEFLLFFVDGLLVLSIFLLAYIVKIVLYQGADLHEIEERVSWLVIIAVIAHWISFYLFELYNIPIKRTHLVMITLIILSVLSASTIMSIISYLLPKNKLGRTVLSIHIPATIIVIYFWRQLYSEVIHRSFKINNIMTVGSRHMREKLFTLLERYGNGEFNYLGSITMRDEATDTIDVDEHESGIELEKYIEKSDVRTLVVDENTKHPKMLQQKLIDLKFEGIEIYDYPTFYSKLTARIPVMQVSNEWVLFAQQDKTFQPTIYLRLKQILDVIMAFIGIFLSLPIFMVITAAIKLTSRGPVLFIQERLGHNEKPFMLIKFRTMIHNAEENTGPVWSSKNDPRITMVGRFLRMTRMDELPQLINILKGEMSFVGPRPIRKHFADILSEQFPFYRIRFSVKPGITGWAQVNRGYAGSEEGQLEKLEYDLFYIRNQSIIFDLFIIVKTINTILFRRGE